MTQTFKKGKKRNSKTFKKSDDSKCFFARGVGIFFLYFILFFTVIGPISSADI